VLTTRPSRHAIDISFITHSLTQ